MPSKNSNIFFHKQTIEKVRCSSKIFTTVEVWGWDAGAQIVEPCLGQHLSQVVLGFHFPLLVLVLEVVVLAFVKDLRGEIVFPGSLPVERPDVVIVLVRELQCFFVELALIGLYLGLLHR